MELPQDPHSRVTVLLTGIAIAPCTIGRVASAHTVRAVKLANETRAAFGADR
jgi:hypothetical protein